MPKRFLEQPEVWLVVPDLDGNPVVYGRTTDEQAVRAVYDKTAQRRADEKWEPRDLGRARPYGAFEVSIPEPKG